MRTLLCLCMHMPIQPDRLCLLGAPCNLLVILHIQAELHTPKLPATKTAEAAPSDVKASPAEHPTPSVQVRLLAQLPLHSPACSLHGSARLSEGGIFQSLWLG